MYHQDYDDEELEPSLGLVYGGQVGPGRLLVDRRQLGQQTAQLGLQGLGWEGDEFSDSELESVRGWLFGKATTIYGGSTEIQNNIIAKRVLGLPG